MGTQPATLENVSTVLAAAPLNDGSVTFTVPHETEVTLSVLYNLPAYSNSAITAFSLSRLSSEILTANSSDVTSLSTIPTTDKKGDLSITPRSGGLKLSGDNVPVRVYTLTGQLVIALTVKGTASISLPAGIYIINDTQIKL